MTGKKNKLVTGISAALSLGMATTVYAAPSDRPLMLDIKTQNADSALIALAKKSGVQIIIPSNVNFDKQIEAISGEYTLESALQSILKGSGFVYEFVSDTTVVIEQDAVDNEEEKESRTEEVDEEIVVTGSRIARTPSQMAANVLVLDGDELRASGESTLEGALRRLPQNMFGASPVAATLSGSMSVNGAINITGASTINLRGLGSESTLILIDGRRIGKTGVFGGVSDITGIPFSAVERVEILLDGASSIYGSDAVGGVVNVIMKKDYQGLEVRHEYSTPEGGGFEEHVFSVNGGFSWDSGQLRATYEHFQSSNLDGEERPESVAWSDAHSPAKVSGLLIFTYEGQRYFASELNPLLGLPVPADPWFSATSEPGVSFDFGPEAFLPDNQDGTSPFFSPDDMVILSLGSPGLTNSDASEGISLIPAQQRDTLNVSFDQILNLLGKEVTLRGTAYYSARRLPYAANGGFEIVFRGVPSDAHLNPFGQPADLFWSIPSLGARHYETDQQVIRWNLALDGSIGDSWRWTMAAGQSQDKIDSNYYNNAIGREGQGGPIYVPTERQTPLSNPGDILFARLIDEGLLNLFASDIVAANSPEVLAQLIKPESPTSAINEESTLEIQANGTLFSLPGGDVYFSIGADWRQEVLEAESARRIIQSGLDPNGVGVVPGSSLTPIAFSKRTESKTQRSGYAEILLPVVAAGNRMTGIEQLTLTSAVRLDSYDEHGSDSTNSLGLIWSPIESLKIKVNQSSSFVSPSFRDQFSPVSFSDLTEIFPDGSVVFIRDENGTPTGEVDFVGTDVFGGNPDLEPERASSLAVGLEFVPDFLPGFTAKATWHKTDYTNRIGQSPTIRFVSGEDYVALYPNLSRDERGLLVRDFRAINIALVEAVGIDYHLNYLRTTDFGQFNVSVNIGYTSKYNHIGRLGDDPINQVAEVGIRSNTVIPKYRYSARLGWYHRGLSINLDTATSSKTISENSREKRTVNPALNANLTMIYDFEQGDLLAVPSWLQDMAVEFNVLNVLDDYTDTSVIDVVTGEPSIFSEYNANVKDPRGRMLKLSVTKRF